MKVGFIGFGNMARALAEGFVRSGALQPASIGACARDWEKLNAYASMSTKNIQKKANISSNVDNSEVSADSYSEVKEAKPGSMMAKANMVRDYNEKNSRK